MHNGLCRAAGNRNGAAPVVDHPGAESIFEQGEVAEISGGSGQL